MDEGVNSLKRPILRRMLAPSQERLARPIAKRISIIYWDADGAPARPEIILRTPTRE